MIEQWEREHSACGVGFLAHRHGESTHQTVVRGLSALSCVEHRGGYLSDGVTGDGAGIMTDIPFELFGFEKGKVAVATLFLMLPASQRKAALDLLKDTFEFMGMNLLSVRQVPVVRDVLGPEALHSMPGIVHLFIERPAFCRTEESFNKRLYLTKQRLRTLMKRAGLYKSYHFASLSTTTIVYKALTKSQDLGLFYSDLQQESYKSRFAIFHRRFSTNTRSAWNNIQPFRLIAHNGEINTIAGNLSSAYTRQRAMGLPQDELLTFEKISDSGSLNEMVEALKYRSSMPNTEDVMAILMPPAWHDSNYYQFWSRAMEAWDGPAFVSYSDGLSLGARMDRNGFRPCRWSLTHDYFYLASEAGVFELDESTVESKGALMAGSAVKFELESGEIHFRDPSHSRENENAFLDARLSPLGEVEEVTTPRWIPKRKLWWVNQEEWKKVLLPMIAEGSEPIGSMGDTARLALMSELPRSFFDYFFQNFAQVTNPPLDYLREKMVTDLSMHLGRQPNIFAPKELLPPLPAFKVESPVLCLKQLDFLRELSRTENPPLGRNVFELCTCFSRELGVSGFKKRLDELAEEALQAVQDGFQILILSDAQASNSAPPLPSLLALRSVVCALNKAGVRLKASIVLACGDIRNSHHLAASIGFGATAVCPVIPLELARWESHSSLGAISAETKTQNVLRAMRSGLLKIMSKMGISVARSYRSSKLFTAVGLGADVIDSYFRGLNVVVGGLSLHRLAEQYLHWSFGVASELEQFLDSNHWFKEHAKGKKGEKHSMTAARSRLVHKLVSLDVESEAAQSLYRDYLEEGSRSAPLHLRDFLSLKKDVSALPVEEVEPVTEILKRFGAGAMSFGAISAESQRDLILAMNSIGGRSNSGEGGENPYFATDGITSSIKQVASARFGVTAEYLATASEIEIKMAQGAKPGEGGQLMAVKVDSTIAKARFSEPGVDLISPPPMHDIYSIEDLKELIYELKQLFPNKPVCVKLVSGANIGTIAAGVVKAGADILQISGGDGGTGAATLVSMKHAGLPWEIGLAEVHRTLARLKLRNEVTLRVDGGLSSGLDVMKAAALGAEEFGFGKLLLVAQGCIMARVCEKNTCPRGIATHDPRFKAKYIGKPEEVVRLLHHLAQEIREHLAQMGLASMDELIGRAELLFPNPQLDMTRINRGIQMNPLLQSVSVGFLNKEKVYSPKVSPLNQTIVDDVRRLAQSGSTETLRYSIRSVDRGALARLCGWIADERTNKHLAELAGEPCSDPLGEVLDNPLNIEFEGSAGQGFGVFLVRGLQVALFGEANDSVCKAMSGGRMVIVPHSASKVDPESSSIIGNCALYGATGGELFIRGCAGDRFAVRNSGALAVVESVGLHACCYMTKGTVVVLDSLGQNIGSGMTGGCLYVRKEQLRFINTEYLKHEPLQEEEVQFLLKTLRTHRALTQSRTAKHYLENPQRLQDDFVLCRPLQS